MRWISGILAALLVSATVHAASAQNVLVVGDQKGGVQALMEAAGVLSDTKYRVEWKEFIAAAPLLEALNAGAIDTGYVGDAPFTVAKGSGLKAKAVAAVRQNQGGLAILVAKSSPIKTADDLKGKSIATGRGSIGHQLVLSFLESRSWTADAMKLAYLQPADAKIAYSTGSVDAWATWEPYVSQEELLFGARRIVTGEQLTPGLSYQVARDDVIAGKREILQDFLVRLARARTWGLTHVPDFAAKWGKLVGIPDKVAESWLSRAQVTPIVIDRDVFADEQKTIDLYLRANLIKKPLVAADVFDTSFASEVPTR